MLTIVNSQSISDPDEDDYDHADANNSMDEFFEAKHLPISWLPSMDDVQQFEAEFRGHTCQNGLDHLLINSVTITYHWYRYRFFPAARVVIAIPEFRKTNALLMTLKTRLKGSIDKNDIHANSYENIVHAIDLELDETTRNIDQYIGLLRKRSLIRVDELEDSLAQLCDCVFDMPSNLNDYVAYLRKFAVNYAAARVDTSVKTKLRKEDLLHRLSCRRYRRLNHIN